MLRIGCGMNTERSKFRASCTSTGLEQVSNATNGCDIDQATVLPSADNLRSASRGRSQKFSLHAGSRHACCVYVRLVNIGALFDALNVLSGGHAFLSFSVKMVSLWLVITGMPPYPGSVSHILQTFVPFFFNEDCLCVCL